MLVFRLVVSGRSAESSCSLLHLVPGKNAKLIPNLSGRCELSSRGSLATSNKRSVQMKAKRMAMGAAVIGCVTAAMMSGAWAQEAGGQRNVRTGGNQQFNAHGGGSASGQLNARQGGNLNGNGRFDSRAGGNHTAVTGELNGARRVEAGFRTEGRGWRGDRYTYRDRGVEVGAGVGVADEYGYGRSRRLYAYAPGYDVGYSAGGYYDYAPGYQVGYTPGYQVGYMPGYEVGPAAAPYYGYAPGISVGIGPVGIGVGPAWGW
jgi:hypothetical protein